MIAFLADESLNGKIIRGIRRRRPEIDLVTVHELGITGADDPTVLEAAAANGRVVLTHDENTMIRDAYARVEAGLPMPGVIVIAADSPIGPMIENIILVTDCCEPGELDGQVRYAPL